jgi:hypothetical protein
MYNGVQCVPSDDCQWREQPGAYADQGGERLKQPDAYADQGGERRGARLTPPPFRLILPRDLLYMI